MADRKRPAAGRKSERQSSPSGPQPEGPLPSFAESAFLWSSSIARVDADPETAPDAATPDGNAEKLKLDEAKLRKASELVGLAVYSWDVGNDLLECDDNLRTMWGLSAGEPLDRLQLLAGIHPDDRKRVDEATAASLDPSGDGRYDIEYRVIGRDDRIERWISTSAQATFENGAAVDFIGVAVDVSEKRVAEMEIHTSEARFRAFAQYSANLLWIVDPATNIMEYCSPGYEGIWGEPVRAGPMDLERWLQRIHPDDRHSVRAAFETLRGGEPVIHQYRIIRPDGAVRWLRDRSFPIRSEKGRVARFGGIAEDLTRYDGNQVYIVAEPAEDPPLFAAMLRSAGFQVRSFDSHVKLREVAAALAPGCIVVDLHLAVQDGIRLTRELRARSAPLPVVIIGTEGADPALIVALMKAGVADYLIPPFADDALKAAITSAMAEMHGSDPIQSEAASRVARLTPREREVLDGLVKGGTNKSSATRLGISPRTVEIYRSQVMSRLDAGSLSELIQTAFAAGLRP